VGGSSPTAGNPVVTGTTITAAWANSLIADLGSEIQGSLSREGKGGMLASLRQIDGSVGSPSIAWTNDTAVGLYRSASGEASIVAGGSAVAKWTVAGFFASLIQAVFNTLRAAVQTEANRKRSETQKGVPKAEARERGGSRDPRRSADRESKTAQAVATKAHVSTATVKRAMELKGKAPALFAQVARGELELNATLREVKRKERHAEIAEQAQSMPDVGEVRPCPIVYADPPWQYGNTAGASAAEDEYPTMALADTGYHINRVYGIVRNGANAGTIQLQFKSEAGGTSVTIYTGSFLRYTRLA